MSKQNDVIDKKEENGQKQFRSKELSAPPQTKDKPQISYDEKALTREEHRNSQEEESGKKKKKREKKGRLRIFPVWLKIIFSLVLFVVAFGGGLMFGYGIVGDGEPRDALEKETWYGIYDFIFEDTEHERE